MPYGPTKKTIEISNGYHVTIRSDIRKGEARELSRRLDDAEHEADERSDAFLHLIIVDWDIDDENGDVLPVTMESIQQLLIDDTQIILAAYKGLSKRTPEEQVVFTDISTPGREAVETTPRPS